LSLPETNHVGHSFLFILIKLNRTNSFNVALSQQDGRHSVVALFFKAALIQVSDYRLLGASGSFVPDKRIFM
jgi:hypothetical protein